jgi:hypothetical protein
MLEGIRANAQHVCAGKIDGEWLNYNDTNARKSGKRSFDNEK